MTEMKSVRIGPEFFQKELREYANWQWAFVREALQNCIDAPGSREIRFHAQDVDDTTVVTWSNNGRSMDQDTIENKLFALGGTGKGFDGTVGGFGKAKTLLYFAQRQYFIRTGQLMVRGQGGDYQICTDNNYKGTKSVVTIAGNHAESLNAKAERFVNLSQWHGTFYVNNVEMQGNLRKGKHRRDFSFGSVYTNKSESNVIVVRIGGIPMFTKHIRLDRCVVLELNGSSADRLTSNRDSLLSKYSYELDDFLTEIAVDRKSALSNKRQTREFFGNVRMACAFNEVPEPDIYAENEWNNGLGLTEKVFTSEAALRAARLDDANLTVEPKESKAISTPAAKSTEARVSLRPSAVEVINYKMRFVIYNKTDRKIPKWLTPGSSMRSFARKLVHSWASILVEMHRITKRSAYFSVGFVFDEDPENTTLACYEAHNGEPIYYINPTLPGFKRRFSAKDKDKLITIAAHEFVHGQYGRNYHDEDFAADFTELMASVMANRKHFNKCFRDNIRKVALT